MTQTERAECKRLVPEAKSLADTDIFQESLFVMIKGSKHINKLFIGNIYRNPTSSPENDMLYELTKYVQKQFRVPKADRKRF